MSFERHLKHQNTNKTKKKYHEKNEGRKNDSANLFNFSIYYYYYYSTTFYV